jgi:hypothetical protein
MSLRRVRCAPWWQEAGIDSVKAARKLWKLQPYGSGAALTHTATVSPRFRQMATEGSRYAKIGTDGENSTPAPVSGDRRAGNHIRRFKEFARLISEILNNSWHQTRAR